MTRFEKIVRFLEKVSFQPLPTLPGDEHSDRELVRKAQRIWDAQIRSGSVIPEGTQFPTTTMGGVEVDWDEGFLAFVLRKGNVVVRDNLVDTYVPRPIDLEDDEILVFHDDQYALIDHYYEEMREELVLMDYTEQ